MSNVPVRKVFSLIRVSTDKQAEDYKSGLTRQRNQVLTSERFHNLHVEQESALEGITGIAVRRTKAFQDLKKALARPDIAGLVIPSIDRLGRTTEFASVAELMQPFEEMLAGKTTKRLFAGRFELDVMNPEHRQIIWDELRYAEKHRENIRFITSSGRDMFRARPESKIDTPPAGVLFKRHDPRINAGTWSYDAEFKQMMREVFLRILNGESLTMLYKEYGFKSRTTFRQTLRSKFWIGIKYKSHTHAEKTWRTDRNKFMRRKRVALSDSEKIEVKIPELRSDPCVPDEVFYAVQAILDRHQTTWTQTKCRLNDFLGTGLVYCSCGRRMYHKTHSSNAKQRYYYCSYESLKKGTPCQEPFVKARLIDDEIALQVVLYFAQERLVQSQIKEALDTQKVADKQRAIERLEKELAELEKQKKNMLDAIRKGDVTREEYVPDLEKVRQRSADVQIKIHTAKQELAVVLSDNDVARVAKRLRLQFSNFTQKPRPEQKELLAKYFQRIEVHRDKLGQIILNFKVKVSLPEFEYQSKMFTPERRSPYTPKKLNGSTIDVLTPGVSRQQVIEEKKRCSKTEGSS